MLFDLLVILFSSVILLMLLALLCGSTIKLIKYINDKSIRKYGRENNFAGIISFLINGIIDGISLVIGALILYLYFVFVSSLL